MQEVLLAAILGLATLALYLVIFFYLYVLVMGIYRVHLQDRLKGFLFVLCVPAVVVGLLFDVFANLFIATFVFWQLPREWLVTTRLTKIKSNPLEHWKRRYIAQYVCEHILDVFDPNGDHC
ncbi:hypothetical protein P26059A_0030 [Curvibacter phage P26059A]|nr:hypothetical protein P26059A_0030 [Curvibacter phage P26059A]